VGGWKEGGKGLGGLSRRGKGKRNGGGGEEGPRN